MKTKKSLTKRFRVTKNGKVLSRIAGQDHFRAKKSGKFKRKRRKTKTLSKSLARQIKKAIK